MSADDFFFKFERALAEQALKDHGPHFEAHSTLFSCHVKNGSPVPEETMQFFADAFDSFKNWSDSNEQANAETRRKRLADGLLLTQNRKGRKRKIEDPKTGLEYLKFWDGTKTNRAVLQLEELRRRKAEDRDGRVLKPRELTECVAKAYSVDVKTLIKYRGKLKKQLDHEFEVRESGWWRLLSALSVGNQRLTDRQFFFKSCHDDYSSDSYSEWVKGASDPSDWATD